LEEAEEERRLFPFFSMSDVFLLGFFNKFHNAGDEPVNNQTDV